MLPTRIFEHLGTNPERILSGFVSRYEINLLTWIAARLPARVTPDHLTILGVAGACMTGLGLAFSGTSSAFLWIALAGLVINWFGDSLDGTLARTRRIERPRFGFFVDHLSDSASQIAIVLGLGLSPYVRFDIACLALITYLVMTIYTMVKLHVFRSMQLTYFGIGPTEVRVAIGLAILTAASTPVQRFVTPIGTLTAYDMMTLAIVAFALISVSVMFYWDASQLAEIDPPRHASGAESLMKRMPVNAKPEHEQSSVRHTVV